jgi:REP element-mobilizing transposase RayT
VDNRASFNPGDPLAYFLTWTTFGTWLPGDERGWKRKDEPEIQPPNRLVREMAESRMKEQAFSLNDDHRRLVEETIRKHCEIRGWLLHALSVRSNHVHVVVTAAGYAPETTREQFKAWSTRNLKGAVKGRLRFWTEGGSCRWINQQHELEAAVIYVNEAQDRKGVDAV